MDFTITSKPWSERFHIDFTQKIVSRKLHYTMKKRVIIDENSEVY